MHQRCNGNLDCEDKSDEVNCNSIAFDAAYLKDVPAPPLKKQQLEHRDKKLQLNISITIESLLELNEVDSTLKIHMHLNVIWIDPRLDYIDLKANSWLNTITMEQKDQLWMPSLIFFNTEDKTEANFKDDSSFATLAIGKGAKPTLLHYSLVKQIIYKSEDW
jgi:hypothetical protein